MSKANPANILCTHPNQYPHFETDVVPGADWELEIRGEHIFYAYHWNEEELTMQYIQWANGNDAIFTSRDEALKAIQSIEKMEKQTAWAN